MQKLLGGASGKACNMLASFLPLHPTFFLPRTGLSLKLQQRSCDHEAIGIKMKYTSYCCCTGKMERAWVYDGIIGQLHQLVMICPHTSCYVRKINS